MIDEDIVEIELNELKMVCEDLDIYWTGGLNVHNQN